jgi:hypothetical protein
MMVKGEIKATSAGSGKTVILDRKQSSTLAGKYGDSVAKAIQKAAEKGKAFNKTALVALLTTKGSKLSVDKARKVADGIIDRANTTFIKMPKNISDRLAKAFGADGKVGNPLKFGQKQSPEEIMRKIQAMQAPLKDKSSKQGSSALNKDLRSLKTSGEGKPLDKEALKKAITSPKPSMQAPLKDKSSKQGESALNKDLRSLKTSGEGKPLNKEALLKTMKEPPKVLDVGNPLKDKSSKMTKGELPHVRAARKEFEKIASRYDETNRPTMLRDANGKKYEDMLGQKTSDGKGVETVKSITDKINADKSLSDKRKESLIYQVAYRNMLNAQNDQKMADEDGIKVMAEHNSIKGELQRNMQEATQEFEAIKKTFGDNQPAMVQDASAKKYEDMLGKRIGGTRDIETVETVIDKINADKSLSDARKKSLAYQVAYRNVLNAQKELNDFTTPRGNAALGNKSSKIQEPRKPPVGSVNVKGDGQNISPEAKAKIDTAVQSVVEQQRTADGFVLSDGKTMRDERGLLSSEDIPGPKVEIAYGTKKIESDAFHSFGTNAVTEVKIPNTVKTIGGYAFYDNKIKELTIPASVTSIGAKAFYASSYHEQFSGTAIPAKVTFEGTKTKLAKTAFGDNTKELEKAYKEGGAGTYELKDGKWSKTS